MPTQNLIKSERIDNSDQTREKTLEQAKREFDIRYAQPSAKRARIEDFELQRTIGTGSFARVILAKHNNQVLALKIMEQKSIVELGQVKQILSENHILKAIDCPFAVSLEYAFKDNVYLYLALEFVNGGDMFSSLR